MRNAETVIDAMLAEQLKPKACSGFALKAYFMQMVVLILRAFASSAGTGNGDGLLRLGQWFRRLEERSGEPLQISELAKEHGMSVRSLERCFLELTADAEGVPHRNPSGKGDAAADLNRAADFTCGLPGRIFRRRLFFARIPPPLRPYAGQLPAQRNGRRTQRCFRADGIKNIRACRYDVTGRQNSHNRQQRLPYLHRTAAACREATECGTVSGSSGPAS